MDTEQTDILICGGGLAGLIAAAVLGADGWQVTVVDPGPRLPGKPDQRDQRSTAFLQPAQALFTDIGLWDRLQTLAVPLAQLRIVDTAGTPPAVRDERTFSADEMGDEPFGWNFLNWQMRQELLAHIDAMANVTLRFGTGLRGLLTRMTGAIASLTDGSQLRAKLVIGADGRNSAVREAAGIGVKTTRYGQKALAFSVSHPVPHNNVSTEIYHQGGPFTMVPLNDVDGSPASAIVWMNPGRRALELAALDEEAFNKEMTLRSADLFGPLTLISPRAVWPIVTQQADRLTAERTAIVAEAAHVLPPIGAQGLNTSVNDIAALLQAVRAHPGDPGEPAVLAAYEKARATDIHRRARAIDLFNRVTRSGDIGLQSLRLTGLKAVHDIAPLRRGVMRAGMGPL